MERDARGASSSSARFYGCPRLPELCVPRARLVARLDSGHALTVVRGPAGSGKSVVLADWARSRADSAVPGVWLTLDDSTRDRQQVWLAVFETVADAGLLNRETVMGSIAPVLERPEGLRRALIKCFSDMTTGLLLILDSFELATAEVAEDLLWVVQHCPAVSLVVGTRGSAVFESAQTLLSFDVTVVDALDLVMTVGETAEALQLGRIPLHHELAADVHAATGGLCLAVSAAALALRSYPHRMQLPLGEDFSALVGDRLRELIAADDRSPRLFGFATRTAIAEVLTVELAAELSGCPDAADLLKTAEQEGLGMWSSGVHGRIFSYTPVLRAIFLAEVAEHFEQERDRLWSITAEWCAAHGRILTAFRLALEIDDLDLASRCARGPWLAQSSTAEMRGFVEIFAPIPRRKLRKQPLLLMALAIGYNASGKHRVRAIETFGLAVVAAKLYGSNGDPGERLLLFGLVTAALRVSGRVDLAMRSAEQALDFVGRLSVEERDGLRAVFGLAMNHIGLTFLVAGRSGTAREIFSAVYSYPDAEGPRPKAHALSLLAGACALDGELRAAEALVAEADAADWPPIWRDGYIGSLCHLARAILAIERFDFESATAELTVMSPHLDTIEHWPWFARVRAMIDLATGDAGVGAARLVADIERTPRAPIAKHARMMLDTTHALLLLATDNGAEVRRVLRPYATTTAPVAAMLASRDLLRGRADDALALVKKCDFGATIVRDEAQLHAIAAAAALRLGRRDEALARLDRLAALTHQTGLRLHLMLIPHHDLVSLSELAREDGGSQTFEAFTDLGAVPDVFPDEPLMAPLTEREMIVLRELANSGTHAAIAEALFVSPNTIKSQVFTIYRKLGVNSREEAVRVAFRRGLLEALSTD